MLGPDLEVIAKLLRTQRTTPVNRDKTQNEQIF